MNLHFFKNSYFAVAFTKNELLLFCPTNDTNLQPINKELQCVQAYSLVWI